MQMALQPFQVTTEDISLLSLPIDFAAIKVITQRLPHMTSQPKQGPLQLAAVTLETTEHGCTCLAT